MTDQKHPGPARDVDLAAWLDGVGFHPADTERKQRGHEAARLIVALLATNLHDLLPAGRDKTMVFTNLEDALIRSNRALALGGGPSETLTDEMIAKLIADCKAALAECEAAVPYDPRIAEYEAGQRGETLEHLASLADKGAPPVEPVAPFRYRRDVGPGAYTELEIGLTGRGGPEPEVKVSVVHHDEGENVTDGADQWINDPEVLEQIASYALGRANDLRTLQARTVAL